MQQRGRRALATTMLRRRFESKGTTENLSTLSPATRRASSGRVSYVAERPPKRAAFMADRSMTGIAQSTSAPRTQRSGAGNRVMCETFVM